MNAAERYGQELLRQSRGPKAKCDVCGNVLKRAKGVWVHAYHGRARSREVRPHDATLPVAPESTD